MHPNRLKCIIHQAHKISFLFCLQSNRVKNIRVVLPALLLSLFCLFGNVSAAENEIYILKISGSINPAVADFVEKGIVKASADGVACVIVQIDTPGGLAESMREIVMAIFASKVPVISYVAPSGARAASAGVMITIAADIAAMAPGTNIGAAHPVGAGGKEIGGRSGQYHGWEQIWSTVTGSRDF